MRTVGRSRRSDDGTSSIRSTLSGTLVWLRSSSDTPLWTPRVSGDSHRRVTSRSAPDGILRRSTAHSPSTRAFQPASTQMARASRNAGMTRRTPAPSSRKKRWPKATGTRRVARAGPVAGDGASGRTITSGPRRPPARRRAPGRLRALPSPPPVSPRGDAAGLPAPHSSRRLATGSRGRPSRRAPWPPASG